MSQDVVIQTGTDLWGRLWAKVDRSGDCWLWTGAADTEGYGQIWDASAGHHRTVTRVVWELTRGPLPDGAEVAHKCDTPACVRPTHLWTGDHLANMQDAIVKGRLRGRAEPLRGEKHPLAKLDEDAVRDIRFRWEAGDSRKAMCKEYGVGWTTIWAIGTRRSWTWLD